MKKGIILVLACLSMMSQVNADLCGSGGTCCANCFGFDSVLMFDVGGGYRNDSLKWTRDSSLNPGQEIKNNWKNIGMGVVEANAYFLACEHFLVKADFDYGWFNRSGHQTYTVSEGEVDLQRLKSRTHGHVYDLSGGLGYQFNFDCYRVSLAPLAGYSYSFQQYKNSKYNDELIDSDLTDTFHNSYKYRWSGPWVGAAFAYQPCCDWLVFFDYAFHWSRLRVNLKEHYLIGQPSAHLRSNQAYGNEFTVGSDYLFCDDWLLGIKFNYKQFWTNNAHYRSEADLENSKVRKLNWISYNITIDIGYKF